MLFTSLIELLKCIVSSRMGIEQRHSQLKDILKNFKTQLVEGTTAIRETNLDAVRALEV